MSARYILEGDFIIDISFPNFFILHMTPEVFHACMKVHSSKCCIEEKGFGFHHKSAFVGRTRKIKDKCILEEVRE